MRSGAVGSRMAEEAPVGGVVASPWVDMGC